MSERVLRGVLVAAGAAASYACCFAASGAEMPVCGGGTVNLAAEWSWTDHALPLLAIWGAVVLLSRLAAMLGRMDGKLVGA